MSTYEYIVKARREDEERARERDVEDDVTKSKCAKQNQVAPDTDGANEKYVPLVVTIKLQCVTPLHFAFECPCRAMNISSALEFSVLDCCIRFSKSLIIWWVGV